MLDNMEVKLVGKTLTITVPDVTVRVKRDGSKVSSVATSHGFHTVSEGMGIALNCNVTYNPKYDTHTDTVPDMSNLTPAQAKAIAKILGK
jgi:hypothetical protein